MFDTVLCPTLVSNLVSRHLRYTDLLDCFTTEETAFPKRVPTQKGKSSLRSFGKTFIEKGLSELINSLTYESTLKRPYHTLAKSGEVLF